MGSSTWITGSASANLRPGSGVLRGKSEARDSLRATKTAFLTRLRCRTPPGSACTDLEADALLRQEGNKRLLIQHLEPQLIGLNQFGARTRPRHHSMGLARDRTRDLGAQAF